MDSWIGHTKQTLIEHWGFPTRTQTWENGEILVYTTQRQGMLTTGQMVGAYDHKLIYLDKDGRIYHWLTQSNYIPAQQLNVVMYVR